MQSYDARKEELNKATRHGRRWAGNQLRAVAVTILTIATGSPSGFAQQPVAPVQGKQASERPRNRRRRFAYPPNFRSSERDFSKPSGRLLGNPIKAYVPTNVAKASFVNSLRLTDLVKNGKIYLSLSDALALALENNYDIAISRYYMDLADLDMLRANAGSALFGSGATVNSFTQGGYLSTSSTGGGPGASTGGAASGTAGLTLNASGAGPPPENMDPSVTGTIQFERAVTRNPILSSPAA